MPGGEYDSVPKWAETALAVFAFPVACALGLWRWWKRMGG